MHVAFLLKKYPKSSETFITNQVRALNKAGHDVDVYAQHTTLNSEETLPDAANNIVYFDSITATDKLISILQTQIPTGLSHPDYPLRVARYGTNSVPQVDLWKRRADPLLRRLDEYDAIHAHYGPVGNAFQFLASMTESPFVTSFYGYDASELLDKNPWRYENLFASADVIASLSSDMDKSLKSHGCPADKIVRFPLPVDTGSFQYTPPSGNSVEPIDVLSACRLVEKKGIKYVLRALENLTDEYNIRYRIAGDGPLRDELEQQVHDLNLRDVVTFEGWKDSDEVAKLMAESDIFVQTSVTSTEGDKEGTPTVLLEAQARGMPVVSTYHAGIPEIVDDGKSGLLVPERDSAAIESALRQLASNPSEWQEYGRRGRELVESRHSLEAVADRLEAIYRNDSPDRERETC